MSTGAEDQGPATDEPRPVLEQRVALRVGGARGFRWGPLDPGLAEALPGWLAGEVPGGEEIKPGRVWRVGDLLVKRYAPPAGLRRLRGSPALRAAKLHDEIRPVRSPRPVAALGDENGSGLLVTEYVAGRFLHRLWDDDPAGRAAFPAFMAGMHMAHVFHGDLNVRNMLWSGAEWVLIDLDGVVRWPRTLARRRLIMQQWARILGTLRGRPGSRELFDSYVALVPPAWKAAALWDAASLGGARLVNGWDEQRARRRGEQSR